MCNGGVQLEWHIGQRTLEIEFPPTGEPEFVCWDRTSSDMADEGELKMPTDACQVTAFENKVRQLLDWVMDE